MADERKQKDDEIEERGGQPGAETATKEPADSPAEEFAAVEEPSPAESVEEAEPVDELEVLRQELATAQANEAEYLDGWQRARAELSNARKRFQREQEQAYANAKADILARLLPIADDLERAFATLPENLSRLTWIGGMKLVQHKFLLLLEQEGVVPIEAVGQEFDPFLHQAITHEPAEEVPEGYVIAEMQKGYKVGERVLRPSVVRVSSGPPPAPEPELEAEAVSQDEGEVVEVEQS